MAVSGSFTSSYAVDGSDILYDMTCMPCIDDGKNTEAVFQCIECQMYYCQSCVEIHNKFVKSHTVLDEAEMKSGRRQRQQQISTATKLPTDTCDEHEGEIIKMYCGSHDVVCCTICIAVNHRSCTGMEYLPKITRSLLPNQDRARAKTNLENVKADLQQLKSVKLKLLQDTKKSEENIIKDLLNSNKRLKRRLEEIERSSVTVVKTKCKQIIDDVNGDVDHIDHMLKDIDIHLRRSSTSDSGDDIQSFVNIKLMQMNSVKGKSDSNEIRRKPLEKVDYTMNTSITSCFDGVTSLGHLTVSEQKLTPYVNILNLIEPKNISSNARSLQAMLKEIGVSSYLIKLCELDANLYTVVICDLETADTNLREIKKEFYDKLILVAMNSSELNPLAFFNKKSGQSVRTLREELQSEWKHLAGIEYLYNDGIYRKCAAHLIELVFNLINK